MNSINTPQQILHLSQSEKEINHPSRKRLGYHVYLSYYFKLFATLDNDDKRGIMIENNIWEDEDDISIDSTLTPRRPMYYEITRAAARRWNAMDLDTKEAWKERAGRLNSRPRMDGTFENVPNAIIESSITDNVLQSLSQDWVNFVRQFKQCILLKSRHHSRVPTSEKIYKFGNEKVVMYSQIYRIFYFNHLLKVTIFGMPLYSKLLPHEVPYQSKKQTIIHLFSHRRISELLNFGGLAAATQYKDGLKYLCCAKVNLKRRGKNSIGYVIDEEGDELKIKMETGQLVQMRKPDFDKQNGRYKYEQQENDSGNQSESFSLTQLWPLRIKINLSGQASFIMSVATYND
jgi:hypothetical protein